MFFTFKGSKAESATPTDNAADVGTTQWSKRRGSSKFVLLSWAFERTEKHKQNTNDHLDAQFPFYFEFCSMSKDIATSRWSLTFEKVLVSIAICSWSNFSYLTKKKFVVKVQMIILAKIDLKCAKAGSEFWLLWLRHFPLNNNNGSKNISPARSCRLNKERI